MKFLCKYLGHKKRVYGICYPDKSIKLQICLRCGHMLSCQRERTLYEFSGTQVEHIWFDEAYERIKE